ncbi:Alanine--tRNA ligase [uncultured archaeon]|nr:Alanine--tRNA ligase [uncultured archaeon]
MVDKDELRARFKKEWQKHYDIKILKEKGFSRQVCQNCKRNFWAPRERKFCADPSCIGYEFIGNAPSSRKLGYVETWNEIKKYFTSHGHGYVAPYPTVARWRDDLYFTIASINDFQPYVVNGELDPPSNPLIVPQPCIRFGDIGNVGVTGRHYTNFVMVGQHAFNTDKSGLFYWKDEALGHDIEYLKSLGVMEDDLVFIEDVWAGGGNYGPSMEYFSRGLELGNCVFMQYEITKAGDRELKTKVIDMGAGLSRLAWITHGSPTSYEIVFGNVIKDMKKDFSVHIDEKLFSKYAKIAGSLNIDEVKDIEAEKVKVAKALGSTKEELFDKLEPLQAIYAAADHTCTTLFTVTDGMLPSNSGGGYNLRLILRRVFGFEQRNNWEFDFAKIVKGHAEHLHGMFPHLKEGVDSTAAVIEEERKKFLATKEKSKGKVTSMLKGGKSVGFEELKMLYTSQGVPPEYVVEVGIENKIKVEMPGNFYEMVRASDETEEKAEPKIDVVAYQRTEQLFYSDSEKFKATVQGILENKYVVLDKTAFYAESGGQVADSGTLEGRKVKNVIKIAGVILHEVEGIASFKPGQAVSGMIDMQRRKAISKNHTAAHMLNAAARTILGPHVWQGGSHKDVEKAHLDITHYKRITQEELNAIERKVNEWVMQDLPIVVEVLPRNIAEEKYGFHLYQGGAVPGKELRIAKIEGVDVEACGGTHHMNKTTGEIGFFKIMKREGVQDGLERITYATGLGALSYVQKEEEVLRSAAEKVSVTPFELPQTVERFFEEWKSRGKRIEQLSEIFAKDEARELALESEKKNSYVFKILDVDAAMLMKIAQFVSQGENGAAALANKQGNLVCACGTKSKFRANEILNEVVKKHGGKGGGSAQLASGRIEKI